MVHNHAAQTTANIEAKASISTILPASTPMPIPCDLCDQDHYYSVGFLRTLPRLTCKDCGDQRQFSQFELETIEKTLKTLGYYIQKT
ncbi:hypothetical protein [Bermanella sp. R86510]|uniref:hypothetical protein n=1 Tax=unclassified Bermanella TaxID=2627862 RepID=UPI0037C95E0F